MDKNGRTNRFLGWAAVLMLAASVLFTGCPNAHGNKPNKSVTTPKYTVTFNVDGEGGSLIAKIGETEIKSGNEVENDKTLTFTAKPEAGFKVKGWMLDGTAINGTNDSYQLKIKKAVIVTVSFEKLPPGTFAVNFGVDGSNGTLNATVEGKEITNGSGVQKDTTIIFTAKPTDNFVVEKWAIEGGSFVSGTGTDGNSTAKIKVTATVTVKVRFIAKPEGTVKYIVEHWQQNIEGNEYTKVETDSEAQYGKPEENTQAVAKPYDGFTAKAITQVKIKKDESTVVRIDYDRNEITLTLDLTGGKTDKVKGRFGAPVSVANPTKAGFTFNGWKPELPKTFPAENGMYTAQWAGKGTYSITYNLDGGTNDSANPSSYNVETETIQLKAATKTGYTFQGWYADKAFTGSAVTEIKKGSIDNKEFWAKWEKNNYKVTFDPKGGTPAPAEQTVPYKDKASTPSPDPKKEGYTLEGWYNKEGNARWVFSKNEITKNTELYAKWNINTYPVSFSVDGTPANGTLKAKVDGGTETETSPITVEYGKTVTFTAAAITTPLDEFTVDKWTVDGVVVQGNTSNTYVHTVTKGATIKVTFKSLYVPVTYAELAEYLANTASDTALNKIEVTGLKPEHLIGDDSDEQDPKPSPLGAILQAHPTKKVALKLGGSVSALMNMPLCFYNCTSLVGVAAIPKGVKDMTDCFDSCKSLTQAPVIPKGVTKMSGCFRDCTSLTQAPVIPEGVENMQSCFSSCKSLTQASAIPEGVKDMSYCFRNCTTLTKAPASIPASVQNMSQCFENCTSLTEAPASISVSVKDMSQCFKKCTSLTQVPAISEGVENMKACFRDCTSLKEVPAIPASVTEMSSCFFNCKALTSVTLKCNYVAGKFDIAFKNCIALGKKSITVPQAYYGNYTTAEALSRMAVPGDNEAEKKAKFEGVAELNP